VVGAEVFSRILDFNDRTTCVLFGDGAGAVVLEASDTPGILASDLHADGKHVGILCVPGTCVGWAGAGRSPAQDGRPGGVQAGGGCAGKRRACTLAKAGLTEADIDWLIPHQANIRIMQSTAKQAEAVHGQGGGHRGPARQHLGGVDSAGAGRAVRTGQVKPRDTVLLEGVGGGFTWGAVLLTL
jgi:3-oxoacyl-[acyl-carrier-protein] synthase-3